MPRLLYISLGFLCLLLGLVGVVLPLLPTTPFVILAAFCFSRGSDRLHRLLLNHRLFGPLIRQWEAHGVIPLRIKWLSTTMMLLMVGYPVLFKSLPLWADVGMGGVVLLALAYIWSRPSRPSTLEAGANRL
ncbi:YbaN family protein [Motiliproteus sp. SC1-56]|uniref:YbaN family protein n=1 Tax=Motiliproteus sp. SC1-56 TaxID=2799565 RepID=UPI001A8E3EB8|nr:YbaN family protein [Motiliproteus sp. SC1-56]